ncbi:PepSY-associated TM helix domain-containing protein [Methylobacterium platani]|uniref:Peptidase n=2 Tax=Methylobacterium platani TaxID=427683 RepID=A0A179SA08_9HYPH|nr:PepSY-associated TM helix domain-containing protein [Methylobacterium platani]KMO22251.1 peptidase [Methylobacterium platani JCM 14648]OAS24594.1 peptidase [Methylobacterium platani]
MRASSVRAWAFVHTWSSLISTLFMLLLCLTGLPLIFHHEIDGWLGIGDAPAALAGQAPDLAPAPADRIAGNALRDHPGQVIQYIGWDQHEPDTVFVILNAAADAPPNDAAVTLYDATRGTRLGPSGSAFMQVMLRLHVDMYAGLPGKLFLGAMGLLLVAAIVSGVVLYWPFTRRLAFGTLRPGRSRRVAWLDLHNLLGIVTVAWLAVVGLTGAINTLSEPMIGMWKAETLGRMIAASPAGPPAERPASLDTIVAHAKAAAPGMVPGFIAFPGTPFATPRHFGVFLRGTAPLTARLLQPVLLDAGTGAVADTQRLPWYLTALLVSQPLHFGDYGGMPMKVLWALLDLVAIAVLGSGLYLWWARRRRPVPALRVRPA